MPIVLIVEDDDLVRELTVDLVEMAGCESVTARNADEAVVILETREDIALVVTDINMAGSMDGLKLAHAVRNRWPPINIIIVSGKMRPSVEHLPLRAIFSKTVQNPRLHFDRSETHSCVIWLRINRLDRYLCPYLNGTA